MCRGLGFVPTPQCLKPDKTFKLECKRTSLSRLLDGRFSSKAWIEPPARGMLDQAVLLRGVAVCARMCTSTCARVDAREGGRVGDIMVVCMRCMRAHVCPRVLRACVHLHMHACTRMCEIFRVLMFACGRMQVLASQMTTFSVTLPFASVAEADTMRVSVRTRFQNWSKRLMPNVSK